MRQLAVLCVGMGVVVGLAACSGGNRAPDTAAATLPSHSTIVEEPSSTFPPLPTAPAAAQKNTPEGAEEFAKHFLTILKYGYTYSDPGPLVDVTLPGCRFCTSVADEMRQQKLKGQRLVGGEIAVRAVLARADGPKDKVVVDGSFTEAASRLVDAQGKTVTTYAPSDPAFLTIAVSWNPVRGWMVVGASIKDTM